MSERLLTEDELEAIDYGTGHEALLEAQVAKTDAEYKPLEEALNSIIEEGGCGTEGCACIGGDDDCCSVSTAIQALAQLEARKEAK